MRCGTLLPGLLCARTDTEAVTSRPNRPEWRDESVHIVDYVPAWPGAFRVEAAALERIIGAWVTGGIHHVGSTAVPGLSAKPVIDILVGVESLEASRPCIELLAPLQYLYSPYRAEVMHWFCKPDPSKRTHHLHLVPTGSPRYVEELAFRNYLRAHPARAGAYEGLKRDLAVRFRADRDGYTEGKAEFVRELTDLALAWSSRVRME
jgi:GrpB-like predicted nucleotidyltransferase (UPF0157 family)